jgi:hypothetical protein
LKWGEAGGKWATDWMYIGGSGPLPVGEDNLFSRFSQIYAHTESERETLRVSSGIPLRVNYA